jgi:hypothetical protein
MAERTEMTPSGTGGGADGSGSRGEASPEQHRGASASAGDNAAAAASQGGEAAAGPTRADSASAAETGAGVLPPRSKRKPAADASVVASSGAPAKHARAAGRGDATAPKPPAGKKPKRGWRDTRTGRVLELLAYLVMLVLVLVYFTGKGLFIYEGF